MMMRSKRFDSFVSDLVKIQTDEERERMAWDVWLFRRPDLSYAEVLAMFNGEDSEPEQPTMSEESKKAVVMEAKGIYERFCLS